MKEHQIDQLTHLQKWWRMNPLAGSGGGTWIHTLVLFYIVFKPDPVVDRV